MRARARPGHGHLLRRDARHGERDSPAWVAYPVVVDAAGRLHYDHFEGRWGDLAHLHRFRQAYAEAATARFARAAGYIITRTAQADGTVRLALSR